MTIRRSFFAVVFALAATASPAAATTWLVPGDGSNTCTTGSPNCNTIAQAVTASANGDTIQIAAGNFTVASTLALTKTLTIVGAGVGITFLQTAPGVTTFSVATSNIVLRDFTIVNGVTGVAFQSASSNNTLIQRVAFSGHTSYGINIGTAAALTVSNVTIDACFLVTPGVIGVRMASTSQVNGLTITGSSFTGGSYGIYQANDGGTSTLTNFTVNTSGFTNITNYAIYAEEMVAGAIEDSSFIGGDNGIGILKFYTSNATAVANVGIRRNQFTGFTGNALDIEMIGMGLGTPGITIEGNTITKSVGTLTRAGGAFVRLHPAQTNGQVAFIDNTITATGTFGSGTAVYGVQLRGNGPVTFTNNLIDGGNVGGSGTTPRSSGIFIQSRSGSVIMPATTVITGSCNRIRNFHHGVSVFDSFAGAYGGLPAGATVSFDNNVIEDNDVTQVANGASPTLDFDGNWWGCQSGCDTTAGAVDTTPTLTAPPACVECLADADCNDELFCTGAETCNAGSCVIPGDPCVGGDVCGDICNEAVDTCVADSGTPCRGSAGPCDVAETCDGVNTACPADAFAPSTTQCGIAGGECDADDYCSGGGPACPDAKLPNGNACTSDGNACSRDECDGVSNACQHPAGNAGAVCRGVSDVCDVAETCDGASTTCPADDFAPPSTVCRAAAGDCDVAESCTGSGPACPADGKQPDGTTCDDGMTCTLADACSAGVCTGNSMTCGDGITQGTCGELCDDGNMTSGDGCSATCQPEFVCTPTPLVGCRTAESAKSQLQLKDKSPDTKDQSQWKYSRGAVTPKADFGNPTAATNYQFCIYAGGSLVSRAFIPAGGTCGTKPCWKANAKGFQYKDKDATPDGITQLKLKEGLVAGKSQIQVKGKGGNLDMPTLPLAQPVRVQIRNTNGVCWETTHSAPAGKNDSAQFKDKND